LALGVAGLVNIAMIASAARRLLVIAPALIVVVGVDITRALVLSQVVLSLVLPLPMLALVRFSASRRVMGEFEFANTGLTNALAAAATAFVCALNGILLFAIVA
jgi:manganese transport protein